MTISSVGSSSLLQQLLQARASTQTQAESATSDPFASVGQNMPSGGKNAPPPPMQGWSSSGQGFSTDTLASLLSTQQTDQSDRAASMFAASMFADADADGDGAVTSDELATAMAAHAPADLPSDAPSATDMASTMLSSGDSDGDGSLSLSEFQAMKPAQGGMGGPHGAGGPPPGPPSSGGSDDSGSASTDAADLNGDGVVSAAELAQTLTSAADSLGSDISSDASDLMQKLLTQLANNLTGSTTSTSASSVDVAA
jgi:Ca2+-binding EF-hand superfamily protein